MVVYKKNSKIADIEVKHFITVICNQFAHSLQIDPKKEFMLKSLVEALIMQLYLCCTLLSDTV